MAVADRQLQLTFGNQSVQIQGVRSGCMCAKLGTTSVRRHANGLMLHILVKLSQIVKADFRFGSKMRLLTCCRQVSQHPVANALLRNPA
ncbi:hypothetical protein D1872_194550 [compost metagenome]